jgi:hypothetical protein
LIQFLGFLELSSEEMYHAPRLLPKALGTDAPTWIPGNYKVCELMSRTQFKRGRG